MNLDKQTIVTAVVIVASVIVVKKTASAVRTYNRAKLAVARREEKRAYFEDISTLKPVEYTTCF